MAAVSMTMAVAGTTRFTAVAAASAHSNFSRNGAVVPVGTLVTSSMSSCVFSLSRCSLALRAEVTCVHLSSDGCAEPKWKQKLAAADEHQERTRQATLQAQEEYRRKQDALRRQQSGGSGAEAPSLDDLEYIPYLTEEGYISDPTQPGAKASVYAIFDENKTLCYIGVSRQVYQSMRLHFARRPLQCHYIKVMNVAKPSRALLEGTRDTWISSNGSVPVGNDNGEVQNIWENPLDCTRLMTDEEKVSFEEAAPGPPKAKVLKNVAKRIQKNLEAVFKERAIKDVLRFDPKLKDRGLLDLKGVAVQPDTSVPTSTPKSA